MEIWKPVKDYEDKYEVSNLGRIKSVRYNRTLKVYPSHVDGELKGYRACFTTDGKSKWRSLARVVYEAFNGDMPKATRMSYIDGDPQNCALDNLTVDTIRSIPLDELAKLSEVMTTRELAEYYEVDEISMYRKLKYNNLKAVPATMWNAENVERLAELSKTHTQAELAEIFGVAQTRISAVMARYDAKKVDHRLKYADKIIDWSQEVDKLKRLAKTHTQAEIAEIYDTSASNIWQSFQRYNIQSESED